VNTDMVKTNGAEFKKFYSDPFWDDGCYHDDVAFKINGKVPHPDLDIPNIIGDTDVVEFEGGFIVMGDDSTFDFEKTFLNWKKEQTMVTVVVWVPRDKLVDLQAVVTDLQGEIL